MVGVVVGVAVGFGVGVAVGGVTVAVGVGVAVGGVAVAVGVAVGVGVAVVVGGVAVGIGVAVGVGVAVAVGGVAVGVAVVVFLNRKMNRRVNTKTETGRFAFPVPFSVGEGGPVFADVYGNAGMTLRDYFAAKAMQGIMANLSATPERQEHFDNIAIDSYRMADANNVCGNVSMDWLRRRSDELENGK